MSDEQRRLTEKLNLETAKLPWQELQTFFASGSVIWVDNSLDLLQVGEQIAADNSTLVKQWMQDGVVAQVSDQQAQNWHSGDHSLWTMVIKPWVLVQTIES
ncbi:MAG: DUF2288 domain-containing protein [Pseudomonadota bacterium]